jgi:hypothetical protein
MNGVLQSGNVTPGHLASWVTDSIIEDAGITFSTVYGRFVATAQAVNFNSPNTDTPISLPLPLGYTRYRVSSIMISGATGLLTTSTVGVFTTPGGGGVPVVSGGTAVTVNQTTTDTVGNMQTLTINNQNTMALSDPVLFFHVQTPQGAGVFANVSIFYDPLP